MKIAYIISHYPKVSHSFIRREILALESLGATVERIAIRGWDEKLPDAQDRAEATRTRYVLRGGMLAVMTAVVKTVLTHPRRFFRALSLATAMGRRSDRSLPYHWTYLAEACVILGWIDQAGVEHLHAHFGSNPAEVAMLASVLSGRPYSFTAHGTVETDHAQFIGISTKIKLARFVVAVSAYGRAQMMRWVGSEHWQKIHVVRCGVEASFHANAAEAPSVAARVVCVGRLSEEKGQLVLLAALRQLLDSGGSCELVLAGDGEMRGVIEAKIAELRLQQHVRITGWISGEQVRDEIMSARALVLPSFAEGLPAVIMEAMTLRRPVVSTYVGGIPELVQPGKTGWLVPPGNVDQLALALAACLRTDSAELRAMGEAARAKALQQHDVVTEAAKLLELFRGSALSSRAVAPHAHPFQEEIENRSS